MGTSEKKTGRWLVRIAGLLMIMSVAAAAVEIYEVGGLVSVEAEHASAKGKWKEGGPDRNSSGKYMIAQSAGSRSDALVFPINFTSGGMYWVYLRARAVDGSDGDWTRHNDAFVSLNGNACVVRDGSLWREVDGIVCQNRVYFFLSNEGKLGSHPPEWARAPVAVKVPSAGKHSLQIGARSSEYEIDKILLLHESRSDALTIFTNYNPPETNSPTGLKSDSFRVHDSQRMSSKNELRLSTFRKGAGHRVPYYTIDGKRNSRLAENGSAVMQLRLRFD